MTNECILCICKGEVLNYGFQAEKLATTSENARLNDRASVPRLSLCILIDEAILSIFGILESTSAPL